MSEPYTLKVELFGKERSIKSPAGRETTEEYAEYVSRLVREISEKIHSTDPGAVSALALFHITHELFTLREKIRRDDAQCESRLNSLVESARSIMTESGEQTRILPD